MGKRAFTAALVQLRTGRRLAANVDPVVALAREAADGGAHLVQTPEMTNLLERDRAALLDQVVGEDADPVLAALRDVARTRGLWVHAGSLAIREGERVANRGFVIDPAGAITARYDKIHLFDVDLSNGESWRESRTFAGGGEAVVAPLPWATLGLSICYDLRFPALFQALARAGADVLTAPACFTRVTGEAHWEVLQRARAIECGAFVLSAAQGGVHEDGRESYGHSIAVDPWGRVLARAATSPGVTLARVDPAEAAAARARVPALANARPFRAPAPGAP